MKLLSALDISARPGRRVLSRVSDRPLSVADQQCATPPADLAALADRVDRDGLDSLPTTVLRELAGQARHVGVHPEVAALLTDAGAPAVVRLRAFGLVRRRLSGPAPMGLSLAA